MSQKSRLDPMVVTIPELLGSRVLLILKSYLKEPLNLLKGNISIFHEFALNIRRKVM